MKNLTYRSLRFPRILGRRQMKFALVYLAPSAASDLSFQRWLSCQSKQ
jgi:hypothetical protein